MIDNIMRKNAHLKNSELMVLTGASYSLIRKKRKELNLQKKVFLKSPRSDYSRSPWSPSDISFLMNNHLTMSDSSIAKKIGRSRGSVYSKRISLCFSGSTNSHRFWTVHEVFCLELLFPVFSISRIASNLDRSYDSVKDKAERLGLKK